jgi:thioredoxin reductase (NADPH)
VGLNGAEHIESIVLNENEAERTIPTDYFIPFWSYAKARSNWKLGLEIEKNAIKVDNSLDYQTNIPGISPSGT